MQQKILHLTNGEIYHYAEQLQRQFANAEKLIYDAITNFCLQYNFNQLMPIAQMIEKTKTAIGKKYGTLIETDTGTYYKVKPEYIDISENELEKLFSCEHDVQIYTVPLSSFQNASMSLAEMQGLFFMIDNDLIEEKKEVP